MYLTLEGPDTFWPLCWGSKRQGATARSTCEAEIISLGSGAFGEGAPMQDLFQLILNRPIDLVCHQDNASVIQIVHGGYSPKLRHLAKVRKINLSALYELFEEPDIRLQYIKTQLQELIHSSKRWNHASGRTHWICSASVRRAFLLEDLDSEVKLGTKRRGRRINPGKSATWVPP